MNSMFDLSVFLSDSKIKAVTISVMFSTVFLLVPYFQKRISSRLTAEGKETFNSISRLVNLQVGGLPLATLIYAWVAWIRKDMSFISGDVLPFVILGGAVIAAGNIWLSCIALKKVVQKANNTALSKRKLNIADVNSKVITVSTVAVFTAFYGLVVLLAILLAPSSIPAWLWYINFLMTAPAIYCVSWSVAIVEVAEEYARR
ncbi:hypothetical protein [Serratia fonticola]|uniref:hypothetical protein n=1 Tax=Serratia fonticola TaxID=47917 RepID=UPI003AFF9970